MSLTERKKGKKRAKERERQNERAGEREREAERDNITNLFNKHLLCLVKTI